MNELGKALIQELCDLTQIPFTGLDFMNRIFFVLNGHEIQLEVGASRCLFRGKLFLLGQATIDEEIVYEALKANLSFGMSSGPWLTYDRGDATLLLADSLLWQDKKAIDLKLWIEKLVYQQIQLHEAIEKQHAEFKKKRDPKQQPVADKLFVMPV